MKRLCLCLFIISSFFFGCSDQDSAKRNHLVEFKESYKTEVPEPSGLALSFDKTFLWTVSDNNSTVYKISFQGKVLGKFTVKGEDLEGIAVIDDSTIAVVLERVRSVVVLSTEGREIKRVKYDDLRGAPNSGLEGITYVPALDKFYLVNEKTQPLFIETDGELNITGIKELKIAQDLSGICYDSSDNTLWIISDKDKMIAKCNMQGEIIDSFRVNIPQIEGIAVDNKAGKMYVISDVTGDLYVYKSLNK